MKTAVTLRVETYNDLLGRCLLTSREYAILRNGIVSHGNKRDAVRLLCEAEDAELVYSLAARFYPGAVSYISKSVDRYNLAEHETTPNQATLVNNGFDFQATGKEVFWGEVFPSEHCVQIYDNDSVFMDTLEGFIKDGVRADEGVVVIATPAHLRALETRLEHYGLDLNEVRAQDRYIGLEAEQVVERSVVNRWLDDERFKQVVADVITRARGGGRKVRAFGEIAAILWARGNQAATVRLEHLWNDLCQAEMFSLFCAYPRAGFTRDFSKSINEICAAHSRVLAA
jgi:DcmR-like sensory protein